MGMPGEAWPGWTGPRGEYAPDWSGEGARTASGLAA